LLFSQFLKASQQWEEEAEDCGYDVAAIEQHDDEGY
jgi:hypothetical protein